MSMRARAFFAFLLTAALWLATALPARAQSDMWLCRRWLRA